MENKPCKISSFKRTNCGLLLLLLLLTPLGLQAANSAEDDNICPEVIAYGLNPETDQWEVFQTPCDVPAGWIISLTEPNTDCPKKITYGQNPDTKNWYTFSTTCDVPDGWISSPTLPDNDCLDESIFAQNPKTQNWYTFSNSCDVPSGWISSPTKPNTDCSDAIRYAQNPETQNWYAFSNSCDVPSGWITSPILPGQPSDLSCSSFYATYSQDGKLKIPYVVYTSSESRLTVEVNMEQITAIVDPLVFALKDFFVVKEQKLVVLKK
jgi:uncharacterized protein YbdZ (MbtH family)